MTNYLRVANGIAVELWIALTVERDGSQVELTPVDCFQSEVASTFVPAGSGKVGMVTADGGKTWAAPAAPPVDLNAYAASARYAKETAGITVGTALIATDRDSQAMIGNMVGGLAINPNLTASFKTANGVFVTINADQIHKIGSALLSYVQSCFTAEAQVVAGIASGSVKTMADVDKVLAAVVSTFPSTAAGASAATGTAGASGSPASSGATS